jgi:membrane protein
MMNIGTKLLLHMFWRKVCATGRLLHLAALEFIADDCAKLSASLSYFTLFSLAPMMFIVIAIGSILFGKEVASGYLYAQFERLLGKAGAMQLHETISNTHFSGDTPWITMVGLITFFFGATAVFIEIQDSINIIWSIKAKPKQNWVRYLTTRLISFSMVVGIGFLLMVSLILSALLAILDGWIIAYIGSSVLLALVVSNTITAIVVMVLFAVIFKVLPDAKLHWRDVMVGAFFTTLLFLVGKSLIGTYLSQSSTVSAYGAAGAVVLVLLWIYYSAMILYFGAEFTKVYANEYGGKIRPSQFAVFIEKRELLASHMILATEEIKVVVPENM